MSQTSRNKNLLLSTPYLFQRQLFDFLSLKTRLNLRKCSKRCQALVDNMPLTIDSLEIFASRSVLIKSKSEIETNDKIVNSYSDVTEAANETRVIFSNPNLKIGYLKLNVDYENCDIFYKEQLRLFLAMFLNHLKSIISSLPHQIHVQRFFVGGDFLTSEDYCELLSCLKPEKLQSINFLGIITKDASHKIALLEQIKRVPTIIFFNTLDRVPFEILSNTPKFYIPVENFSKFEFNRVVEQYLQRDNFVIGRIVVRKERMEPWITAFLMKNAAVKTDDGSMTVTLEGPKFKNTVNVGERSILFRRTI